MSFQRMPVDGSGPKRSEGSTVDATRCHRKEAPPDATCCHSGAKLPADPSRAGAAFHEWQ